MKRIITALVAIVFIITFGCKKTGDTGQEVALAKKYAKYKAAVYKEIELKTWLATLEKSEDVVLLNEEKYKDKKGVVTEVSKVKLADESVGYIDSKRLADAPIVFTADTKAYVRPTSGSTVFAIIPKGELGFIIGEKGLWVQIHVGDVDGKQVTQQWIEGGYSNDPKTVTEARDYAASVSALKDKDREKAAQAKASLEKLAEGNSVIAELAKEKLGLGNSGKLNEEKPAEKSEGVGKAE